MDEHNRTLPSRLAPESVIILVDSREQNALDLSPLSVETACLQSGDYAIKGMEHLARIERKSLSDLLMCCGQERDRFEREIERLLAFDVRVLLVEACWGDIEIGQWRSRLTPAQVQGSLVGWAARGIQVELVGNHDRAGRFAAKLLYTIARRRWEELRRMHQQIAPRQLEHFPSDDDVRGTQW